MKHFSMVWVFLVAGLAAKTQPVSAENTFAVVVGVANYENERINLSYANRDAVVFAEYLQSAAGGRISQDNIRLLTDTNATTAAVYNALAWVQKKTELARIQDEKAKCLVYFYFSGHGDVETMTRDNLGFLLTFNSPPNNYMYNAVRLEDLNRYANTLSVDLNANVVIITDACRSGKLAGSKNKGSSLVGKELAIARSREVRIASCEPEELSMEDERWGNGRGVFSWYLINGLKGMADINKDNSVTLDEVKQFVASNISTDPVLKELKHRQTPVLKGEGTFKLAAVHPETRDLALVSSPAVPQPVPLPDLFWQQLNNSPVDTSDIFSVLVKGNKDSIVYQFIHRLNDYPGSAMAGKREDLIRLLQTNKEQFAAFIEKWIEWLHTKAQTVINQYLEGDEAELEKRRYYNNGRGYQSYADMLGVALLLADKADPLHKILSVNHLYLSGVALRLQMPAVDAVAQRQLLEKALAFQLQAQTLDDNTAYVQNELGILYKEKDDLNNAVKYFTRAGELAPSWSLPKANLCGTYAQLKKWELARENGEEAERLQPGSHTTQTNMGVLHERMGNLLYAEENYRQAIAINGRHYFPFERLGNIYYRTTQYALADSFFYEADLRKKGFHFRKSGFFTEPWDIVATPAMKIICPFDTSVFLKDDIMAFLYVGKIYQSEGNHAMAEHFYKKIIALDPRNPLVFHYMGNMFYDQGNWERGELHFLFATDYYLSDEKFNQYADSLVRGKKYPYNHTCFEDAFRKSYYGKIEDYYFLALGYERNGQYEKAEQWYKKIISLNPSFIGPYIKFCDMLEKQERFADGEKLWQSYAAYDKSQSDWELNNYYRRIIGHYPENGDWYYRLGLLLYEKAQEPRFGNYLDTIIYFPRQNKEVFIGPEERKMLGATLDLDANDGQPDFISLGNINENIQSVNLPGVNITVNPAMRTLTPARDAVYYLSMADSLLADEPLRADIQFKLGNLFVWRGSPTQAFPHYSKATALDPANASIRLNLVDVCKAIYKHRAGLVQLSRLYDSAQINFSKRLLYSEWLVHAGEFAKAQKLIAEAQQIYPYTVPACYDLSGRLHLLSEQTTKAINAYKQYLLSYPNDAGTSYTLARLYASAGNKSESWKWLQTAIKNGFNYGYILNFDPVWNAYRNTAAWAGLFKQTTIKAYRNQLIEVIQ